MAIDPEPMDLTSAPRIPAPDAASSAASSASSSDAASGEAESGAASSASSDRARPGDGADPPGLRDQIAAVFAAGRRLVTAHWELAKAELGQIMGEVGRAAALGCLAAAMVLLAGLLLGIGLFLFLGEWIFGSIGWGVLLGPLLLIDVAVVAGLVAVGLPGSRIGLAFLIALAGGVVVGIVLGLDLTNRAWTAVGDNLLPGVDAGFRPLAIAVLSLAVIGGVIGLVGGLRAPGGSATVGLFVGAFSGIVLGVLTAVALGPQVGAAFGTLTTLIAWPALMGLAVSRTGIDADALKARFYPDQTIETTKETIEWVRHRTPLGRKS